ncbi:phosphoesterase RecJ domain-containing protein [Parelusimicrobium proximum]|uniref:DHH family phosphoesterase n=1 Tax=Parelusimicrobium proximum TaxID=3228953 RepID=UPI003D16DA3A
MTSTHTLKEIAAAIKKGKKVFVAGHQNPDGDSIGSTLAVTSMLRRMGKDVYPYADNATGDDLHFLPGLFEVNIGVLPDNPKEYDTIILLECSEKKRAGAIEPVFEKAKRVINIDHHITGEAYGDFNYIDAKASSTAEIILQMTEIMKIDITPDEATCLYTGLVTDTARFLHSNTTAEALRAGSELVRLGADIKTINQVLYFTRSYSETKLLGRALEKMRLFHNNTLAMIILTLEDFSLFGAEPAHTQGIVSQPVMIPGVEVSILIKEEADKVSVNLRSSGAVDVSRLAQGFGGGGHARAAGFKRTDMGLIELAEGLRDAAEKLIDESAK